MKQFLKFTFASCLGTFLAMGVILFLLYAIAAGSSAPQVTVNSGSVLHLKLSQPIPELTDNVPQGQFGLSEGLVIGLNDVTRLLRRAADDKDIAGILIQTEMTPINPTTAYAIAKEIEDFKRSGKLVYAYGDYFTQSGYIIAAIADSVYLNPNGLIDLRGYGTTTPYFAGLREKTGIDFDVYHAGKYKSAVEPYYRGKASAENRYQTKSYLSRYHSALVDHIATYRTLNQDAVNEVIVEGNSNNSDDAINHGLADRLAYPEDIHHSMGVILDEGDIDLVSLETYYQARPKKSTNNSHKVAVIYAEGDVAAGGDQRGAISMKVYDGIFDRIEKSKSIDAVVLRVNSPGGSSFTSDRFYKRVQDLRAAGKYVVASFGDYAASGGYYIAAGADRIISEPTTLTGSIGVYSMMPDFSELSEEELGILWDTIGTGKRTFLYSTFISRSPGDNALLMSETERVYRAFKKVVSEGREMPMQQVEEVAQGRVWSGLDALETGLIDTIGGLGVAIDLAAKGAGYEDFKVLEYPIIEKSFWELMAEGLVSSQNARLKPDVGISDKYLIDLQKVIKIIEASCTTPQARLPLSILVN